MKISIEIPDEIVAACTEIHEWNRTGLCKQDGELERRRKSIVEGYSHLNDSDVDMKEAERQVVTEIVKLISEQSTGPTAVQKAIEALIEEFNNSYPDHISQPVCGILTYLAQKYK